MEERTEIGGTGAEEKARTVVVKRPTREVIDEGVDITEESNPDSFEPADPQGALNGFIQEFGLPKNAQLADVIQHVVDTTGQSVTLAMLMQITWLCGGTLQLEVTSNESVDPFTL